MAITKDIFDEFYDDLDKLSFKLFDNVKKMGKSIEGFSDTEILRVARELDFFRELQESGFNTSFQKLMQGYDTEAEGILKDFQKTLRARTGGKAVELLLSPANTEAIAQRLQLLRDLDGQILLGRFAQETATMKAELFKGIISGEPAGIVAERLALNFDEQLLSKNARMIARDAYQDFGQTGTFDVFKQVPDQKFRYSGSVDKKNRPACRYFIDNQKDKKGYTAKEIQELSKKMSQGKIALPVYDKKKGWVLERKKAKFSQIQRGGHNCRHRFIPVGTRA
tara:strand:+ start:6105 stop:6944 length:840 start_codon:yes stop_codon:yes gene_type:complete